MKEINSIDVFKKEIQGKKVVLKFSAEWCGPCKQIAPFMEELATKNNDISFYHIDIDEYNDLASQYSVSAVPTIAFINDGKIITTVIGGNVGKIKSALEELQNS